MFSPSLPRLPLLLATAVAALALHFAACSDDGEANCTVVDSRTGERTLVPGDVAVIQVGATCERCRCMPDGTLNCRGTACDDDGRGGDGQAGGERPGTDGQGQSQPSEDTSDDGPSGEPSGEPSDNTSEDPLGPVSSGDPGASGASSGAAGTDPVPPGPPGINMPRCGCPVTDNATGEQMAAAIGMCGDMLNSVERVGDSRAFAVREDYFGILSPGGGCIGVMSTGLANAEPTRGGLFDDGGVGAGTAFDSDNTRPNPNPEGGPAVYDLAQIIVELTPPPGALGLRFNFMFLSAEWPQYLCQQFNDTYLTIVETQALNMGQPMNISFDQQGNLISVNAAFLELPRDWTTNLSNTPFGQPAQDIGGGGFPGLPGLPGLDAGACPSNIFGGASGCTLPDYCEPSRGENLSYVGSGTGWLFSQAPIFAGEDTVKIVFSIHDEGDAVLDSKVLISDFRWLTFSPPVFSDKI